MLLQCGCFYAGLGEFLRRARCGREALHAIAIGLCAFPDNGEHGRFASAGYAVQADDPFTREEKVFHGGTLRGAQPRVPVFDAVAHLYRIAKTSASRSSMGFERRSLAAVNAISRSHSERGFPARSAANSTSASSPSVSRVGPLLGPLLSTQL